MSDAPKEKFRPSDAIIADMRLFLKERFDANLADVRRSLPPHIFIEFGRRGYVALTMPKDQHGCGLSLGDSFRVIRFLSIADLSLAVAIGLHNILGLRSIMLFASESAKAALEADCARGARLCAFALTEKDAGSDPRRLRTQARRQADGSWILNGSKMWTGLGAWCGAVVTFAQAYDEDDRPLGITGFVFPAETAGFRVGKEAMTLGLRGTYQGAIHFEDLRVKPEGLLGKPGEGLAQASKILMGGRIGCVAFSSGAMHRCLQIAGAYIAERKIATGLMIENGVVYDTFARMLAKTVALDIFFDWLCDELDERDPLPDELYCAAKIIAPEWAFQVADACMQLMGGRGYEENNVVARIFRDIRVIRIFEGPTETIRHHLGGLVVRTDDGIQKILCDRLDAKDVFQILSARLSQLRSCDPMQSRSDQQRRLSWLGEIAAHALLWAVVRLAGAEQAAARIAEEYFRRAIETPIPDQAWASEEEVEHLRAVCETITGDVEPHQPGENWTCATITAALSDSRNHSRGSCHGGSGSTSDALGHSHSNKS